MKKLAAPLQAFAALFLCSGMAWMVFVLTSINPVPPTAADLQARNTQDLSFANMNSTAVALAQQMLANMVPSPSRSFFMPVTGRETLTATPFAAVTLKPVYTTASSATPSAYRISPTATRRNMADTAVPTVTHTSVPEVTRTPVPTDTLRPLTSTAVATQFPTNTKQPTVTPIPTQTQSPAPTDPPTQEPSPTLAPTDPPATVPPTPTDSYP